MRTGLICHHDNVLNREVLPRWLASFSELAGVVIITETGSRARERIRFEWRRSGLRMLDVLAFRLYYRLRLAERDGTWVRARTDTLLERYPPMAAGSVRVHHTADPNDEGTRRFLASARPDLVIARCKTLLQPKIFNVPRDGTIVLHPGICPEYRNAHGCFWALARRDLGKVGATMLRIDEGVDTGPVYDYYHANIDERSESHVVIEYRVVFDNLDRVADDLRAVHERRAQRIDTTGRASAAWGQPRLSDYLRWKRAAAAR
jgi:folate-dependent phosphoribosylglycinamide formyltransferase PurN